MTNPNPHRIAWFLCGDGRTRVYAGGTFGSEIGTFQSTAAALRFIHSEPGQTLAARASRNANRHPLHRTA